MNIQEIQFYMYCFRDLVGIFAWNWVPREPFWVTLGAFSSLWGTFELLATPGSKINDFTWEGVPCFETYFWTILVNFSCCFLGVLFGVLRVAFLEFWWFLGSLVGFIFGGIFEKSVVFLEKVVPSILNDLQWFCCILELRGLLESCKNEKKIRTEICCFFRCGKYVQKRCFYIFLRF